MVASLWNGAIFFGIELVSKYPIAQLDMVSFIVERVCSLWYTYKMHKILRN